MAAAGIPAAAGAAIEPRTFDPQGEDLAGLPTGRFLKTWLGEFGEGLTTALPCASFLF